MIARRTFIKSVSMGYSGLAISAGISQAQQVPNSSGTEPAKLKANSSSVVVRGILAGHDCHCRCEQRHRPQQVIGELPQTAYVP